MQILLMDSPAYSYLYTIYLVFESAAQNNAQLLSTFYTSSNNTMLSQSTDFGALLSGAISITRVTRYAQCQFYHKISTNFAKYRHFIAAFSQWLQMFAYWNVKYVTRL